MMYNSRVVDGPDVIGRLTPCLLPEISSVKTVPNTPGTLVLVLPVVPGTIVTSRLQKSESDVSE